MKKILGFTAAVLTLGLVACTSSYTVKKEESSALKAGVYDTAKEFEKDFPIKKAGFEFEKVVDIGTAASVEFFKIKDEVKMHKHPKENHILYVLSGKAEGTIGDTKDRKSVV